MIINSLLDQDMYKYSMMQCVFHHFPTAWVKYKFKCRNEGIDLFPFKDQIEAEIDHLCSLNFTEDELNFLGRSKVFDYGFIHFLRGFKLNRENITVSIINNKLDISIEGYWVDTILFEVPVLAIVQEIYFKSLGGKVDYDNAYSRLYDKIIKLKNYKCEFGEIPQVIDFGTRRRIGYEFHSKVISYLSVHDCIIGTSNVRFAMDFGLKPIGTHAHEFICAGQAFVHPLDSQKYMLDIWCKEYPNGKLAIALSDTLGFKKFLKDFDYDLASRFKGIRQDSGIPDDVADLLIKHYEKLGIDPKTKFIVFSDNLTIKEVLRLYKKYHEKINVSFGVGTNLVADCNVPALQNVIKLVEVNGRPVAKLSDSKGKEMCQNPHYVEYLRDAINNDIGE